LIKPQDELLADDYSLEEINRREVAKLNRKVTLV